jgi:hypothetical protein
VIPPTVEIAQLPATPIVQLEKPLIVANWPFVVSPALRFGTFHSIKVLFNAKKVVDRT